MMVKVRFNDQPIQVRVDGAALVSRQAALAENAADRSQDAADFAEGFTGPVYASVSAGEAATTPGQIFRVSNGDGPPETTTAYRRTSGGSVVQAPLATTAALASTEPGKGAGMVAKGETTLEIVTPVTPQEKGALADGSADDTAAVQAAIDALASGGTLKFPRGTYKLSSGIVVSGDDVTLDFEAGAALSYETATMTPITLAGARNKISGGVIKAPAVFDGTNAPIGYSVVKVTGEFAVIDGLVIENVPRAGIWFSETNNGIVSNCIIDGGTPEGFYNGSNTVHFGVIIDPAATGSQGNFVLSGNIIRRCTQGAGSGNTGGPSYEQAIAVSGNVFELCWNHGWYSSGLSSGSAITGNVFSACQIPVAVTGTDHVIDGNTLFVQTTAGGSPSPVDNEITGISLRDPVRCIVTNNVIKGEGINGGTVISFDDNSGVTGSNKVTDNICANNVIAITNSSVGGVVAIRFLGNSTEVSNNICEGNTISAPSRLNDALISMSGAAAGSGNNHIRNNIVKMTRVQSAVMFVSLAGLRNTVVAGNTFELAADAAAPMTLISVSLASCSHTRVDGNDFICTAAWGANVAIRAVQELTAGSGNSASGNRMFFDPTKLTSGANFFPLTTSGFLLDHAGVGAPEGTVIAAPGSVWRRTDGGAGTTLYVKESGTSNTGWRSLGQAAAVANLGQTISDPPTQSQVQAISSKVDALLGAMRTAGLLGS